MTPPLRSPRPGKAQRADGCTALEQIPNIGASLAADLRSIGIAQPGDLVGRDPFALYQALCRRSGQRQDPCVLDTFMAATDFMGGAAPRPWWRYTAHRKALYGALGPAAPGIEKAAAGGPGGRRRPVPGGRTP
jgi:hypothetical protein